MSTVSSKKGTPIEASVYIDESGDLGVKKGTRWFVLTAVIVDKSEEKAIRDIMSQIKSQLNIDNIHFRKITDFYKRAFLVKKLNETNFTYINVIFDTNLYDDSMLDTSKAYNYMCRYLLERVSWFLKSTNRIGDIVLSARGTKRDGELITYITDKLLPYDNNSIYSKYIKNVCAKSANSWDLLQLADVCATTTYLAHETNKLGFTTPCFFKALSNHIYRANDTVYSYGMKYFFDETIPESDSFDCLFTCIKNEESPSTTTT